MKLKPYRHEHDTVTLEVGLATCVYISILEGEDVLGEIGIDRYGRELRVHVWNQEDPDGDPVKTIKLADLPARSILDVAREKE